MIRKMNYSLVLLASILFLVSCSTVQPVLNLQKQPVGASSTSHVKQAILAGAKEKNWHTKQTKPGVIFAWINVRTHYAAVNIKYSNKGYSINYADSRNLGAQNGQIHRNYNKWIQLLNHSIQGHLRAKDTNSLHK